jgi:single-strand DNA-binding protein
VHSLRSGLFRSTADVLDTCASINNQEVVQMATTPSTSNQTSAADTAADKSKSSASSVNRVTLVGRLVAAPELRTTGSGKHVTTVRVATNDRAQAQFHDVVLWSQLAEFASQYLGKGRLVYVEGRIQNRSWQTQDGSTRYKAEIVASRFQALARGGTSEPAA